MFCYKLRCKCKKYMNIYECIHKKIIRSHDYYIYIYIYVYTLPVHILGLSDPEPVGRSFSRTGSGDMLFKEHRYVIIEEKVVVYFRELVDLS